MQLKGKHAHEEFYIEPRPGKGIGKLIRQLYACQASREQKPWKNINTDGKERADLQETMRSDSSAVSPHLIWHQSRHGCAAAKSAGWEADVAQHQRLWQEILVPASLPLCKGRLRKHTTIKTHHWTH